MLEKAYPCNIERFRVRTVYYSKHFQWRYYNWAFRKQLLIFICVCRQRANSSWQLKFSQRGSFNRPHYYNWQGNSGENKARDTTKHRGQLHGVTSLGWLGKKRNALPIYDSATFVVAPNSGILKTLLNFELSFWLWKPSLELPTKNSAYVAQKQRSSV